jgi:sugar phosphate isomerase/epimerase
VSRNDTVSRRRFLAAAGTLPLAVSAAAIAAQARPFKVGLQLYSVRNAYGSDLAGTVTAVAKMGYEVVEFWSPYMQWSNARAKEVRRLLDDLGITCPSTHNPASSLGGDLLERAVELNQILGSRSIVAASPPPKLATADAWKAFAETCANAAERLRPLGMTAGFHNHAAEWRPVEGVRPMDILAAGTPRDFVLQLDVGTCLQAEQDPVAWINANPGRIRSMHCKDWGAGEGRGYAVAFGEGDAPWQRIFEAAEAVGGIEHYFLEQEVPGEIGEIAMVQRCLDNYRKLRA